MRLKFTKMHGLGNDFVVIDAVSQKINLSATKIRLLADRHLGVGCDQVLIVEPPHSPEADFRYRIFNANGNEVEHCGNGVRCFASYVQQRKLACTNTITVETKNGLSIVTILKDKRVVVDMGAPILKPEDVPFETPQQKIVYPLPLNGQTLNISVISMGNPHAITIVDDADTYPVVTTGAEIETHDAFPNNVNAGFLQIISRTHAKLRVFERGVGETRACGTGACAAMVAARLQNLLDSKAIISLPGGDLEIEWLGDHHSVIMTGPTCHVFTGQIKI